MSRVRVPAKDEGEGCFHLSGLQCTVLHTQTCSHGFFSLLIASRLSLIRSNSTGDDHPGGCCSLLAATKVTASPPEAPDCGSSRYTVCSGPRLVMMEIKRAASTKSGHRMLALPRCGLLLLRRFHFGLSGVELRLVGLTLEKSLVEPMSQLVNSREHLTSPVPLIMTRP